MSITLSQGKLERLTRVADEGGVIRAAAMDQRGSLKKAIAKAKGLEPGAVSDAMMSSFKVAVSKVLTPHASAILLDPQWGKEACAARSENAGLLLAYELSGYDQTGPGRLPLLLPNWTVRQSMEMGADCIKILMYYTPFEKPDINAQKHAWIERIGAECAYHEIPFFLECICYDEQGGDEKGLEFAKRKPAAVAGYMKEFSEPRYGVDVQKVEVPINMAFVEGASANTTGQSAYSKKEAMELFLAAAEVCRQPFIYLSAGVDDDVFRESLELAGDSGTVFAGVLCGRATWKEGISEFGSGDGAGLEAWLAGRGVENIQALNAVLKQTAKPWHAKYGGLGNIKVVDRTAA